MTSQILSPDQLARLQTIEPDMESYLASPADSPLMRLLTTIDRDQLNQLMTDHRCVPGEIICLEGDDGDAMYLIWSGRIAVLKGPLTAPTILGFRGPGEIIGEMALLEERPRSATNVALDNARLLRIERERFQEWLRSSPSIGMGIMATLSARLRTADVVRASALQGGQQLIQQVSQLQSEKEELLDLQRVRQETSDLIVHDLRNPLSIIYGTLNMLEMVLPERVFQDNQELLELAATACERMQRLVDSMLDVAKFETGEMPLTLTRTPLAPMFEEAAHRQIISVKNRGITIQTIVLDDVPAVLVDTEKLDRILANLLDNALKYSPDDVPITLAAEPSGDYVVVSVTDMGPGIPPEERERIFERFTQISDHKPHRRGFGLGLTFCKLAVEAHGGEIWIEPGPGDIGSRFVFTLPCPPDDSPRS